MKMITIHLVNFIILNLGYIPVYVFLKASENSKSILTLCLTMFILYQKLFLIYLVIKFARNMQKTKFKDPVLSKSVPFTVFLQNQSIYKVACLTRSYEKGEL